MQFTDLAEDVWRIQDGQLRHSFESIQWIFGPGVNGPVKALKARDGYILRARCEFRDGQREVLVRMETYSAQTDWIPLAECTLTGAGIVTESATDEPHPSDRQAPVDHTKAEELDLLAGLSGPEPVPDRKLAAALWPILDELSSAMDRDDCQAASTIRGNNQALLNLLSRSGLNEEKRLFRRIMQWHLKHPAYRRPIRPEPVEVERPTVIRLPQAVRRAMNLVERLETVKQNNDLQAAHEILALNTAVIRKLRNGWPLEFHERFIRVEGWVAEHLSEYTIPATVRRDVAERPQRQGCEDPVVRLTSVLKATAARQRSMTVTELLEQVQVGLSELSGLLIAVERAQPEEAPLLTALLKDPDGKPSTLFREVAVAVGFHLGSSDFGLQLAWRTELDRVHAYHDTPKRPIHAGALRRQR
ncbi:hypothetical protein Ntsu_57160 [Nocardia sp. IFM 10818]